jgi:hypothetical protein
VCICSPTLAQGLDLNFGVLLFRSLYRNKNEPIEAKEFANVIGRVGRAFVDLDGLYVLPIFETGKKKQAYRIEEFNRLIANAKRRQLESGVRMLITHIIAVLRSRLNCNGAQLQEYVLNMTSSWELAIEDGDQGWLGAALNELDTAILGIVDTLDMPISRLAAYLDDCLQNSYWQRRLRREPPELRELQELVIRGRARWLWARTTLQQRKAFFASGIGYRAGAAIDDRLSDVGFFLIGAENALSAGDLVSAVTDTVGLAEILYAIHPFVPARWLDNWQGLLGCWLRGEPLGTFADNDGVSFIQENVVYRLVWAVEAARLHLQHLVESEALGNALSVCLTYGVPNMTAALLMQGGLRSRTLAVAAVQKMGVTLESMEMLGRWVAKLRKGMIPPIEWTYKDERAEWAHFLDGFDHRHIAAWRDVDVTLPVRWRRSEPPKHKTLVRVSRVADGYEADVYSVSLAKLGTTTIPKTIRCNHFVATVSDGGDTLRATFFGR